MTSKRDPALDIMRGVAILSMVEIHSLIHFRPDNPILYNVMGSLGTLAAPFFLICAGMGIGYMRQKYQEILPVFRQTLIKRGLFLMIFASSLSLVYLDPKRILDWDIFTLIGFMYILISLTARIKLTHILLIVAIAILNFLLPLDRPSILRGGSFPIIPFAIYILFGIILIEVRHFFENPKIRVAILATSFLLFGAICSSYGSAITNFSRYDVWSFRGILGITNLFTILLLLINILLIISPKAHNSFRPVIEMGNLSFSLYYAQYFILILLPKIGNIALGLPAIYWMDPWIWLTFVMWVVFTLYLLVIIWRKFGYKYSLEWFMHKYISPRSAFINTE